MKFKMVHNNINVADLEKSVQFYKEALGLVEVKRKGPEDGSFILSFMEDGQSGHQLELSWLRDKEGPYNLGDNEIHLAFSVDDYEAALKKHHEMDCVVYENKDMGIYFIVDPDGYWNEIIPAK
jgi:lactoylglutathione lyase